MALVQLSDVIVPAVYETYRADDNPMLTAFFQSGIAVNVQELIDPLSDGGRLVTIPFWLDLDPTVEPNYSTDDPNTSSAPQKITTGEQQTRVANLNQSWSAADLVSELAGSDPMQRIRNRTGTYWTRQWQRRIVAACNGVLARNLADADTGAVGDMVYDVAIVDPVGNPSDAILFGRQVFTGAVFTLGDHWGNVSAIAVHSVVYKRMVDNDDIEFIRDSKGELSIPTYMGIRVIVDDGMPVTNVGQTSGYVYTSVLFGQGAIGYAEGTPRVPSEVFRYPAQGNGGGVEQLYERKTWMLHPFGYKWLDASVTGGAGNALSPNLTDLANALNWQRVIERKNVPIAFVMTNG